MVFFQIVQIYHWCSFQFDQIWQFAYQTSVVDYQIDQLNYGISAQNVRFDYQFSVLDEQIYCQIFVPNE